VEEGRRWHDKIPGLHCKNLFIKDRKGGIWLVVMPADKRADLGRFEKVLGAPRFSFARPEVLREMLALTPGSVTPLGLTNDAERRVTVVLDEEMLDNE
jgi:Ala-tRNA(Pro) deacylase